MESSQSTRIGQFFRIRLYGIKIQVLTWRKSSWPVVYVAFEIEWRPIAFQGITTRVAEGLLQSSIAKLAGSGCQIKLGNDGCNGGSG